jgi:uncharacterized protein (TIGR02265 family)
MPRVAPPAGFELPDDHAPFHPEAYTRATPPQAQLRGMFFNSYLPELKKRSLKPPDDHSYIGFKMYPMTQWHRFIVSVCRELWPELTLRAAIRRAGLIAYPTFADSMIGRVTFGVLGKDIVRILRIAGKGYEHSVEPGSAETVDAGDHFARIHLRDVWGFADVYNVGVFEGVLKVCDREGLVYCKPHSLCDAEIFVTWD